MSQRSYFIQPKSGSDWSSSAKITDQDIMNEFEKMNVPTYYHQETCEPISTTSCNGVHRSSNYIQYTDNETQVPTTCSFKTQGFNNYSGQTETGGFGEQTETGGYGGQTGQTVTEGSDGQFTTCTGKTSTDLYGMTPLTNLIINAQGRPYEINETETLTVLGQTGIFANKSDMKNWQGSFSLNEYPVNEDPTPEVVHKAVDKKICFAQELKVKYLKPPAPMPPGDIVIKQEATQVTLPAPPIVIRQKPQAPETPAPIVIREAPPKCGTPPKRVEITIPGKKRPPPPRRVIIERLPQIPTKPQQVLVERWLPFAEQKRRVVFQKEKEPAVLEKPRNLIIQWEPLKACVKKEFVNLGVICCSPEEYVQKFGSSLVSSFDLPEFVKNIQTPAGLQLACDTPGQQTYELEGDIEALSLLDNETLERLGLSGCKQYKKTTVGDSEITIGYETSPKYPVRSSKLISENGFEAYKWPKASKKMQKNMDQVYAEVFGSLVKDCQDQITVEEAERVLENLAVRSNKNCKINKINRSQFVLSLVENEMVPVAKLEAACRSLEQ